MSELDDDDDVDEERFFHENILKPVEEMESAVCGVTGREGICGRGWAWG
jgi:hypothetical protein